MLRVSLVQNTQHHRIDGDGLARPCCACDQEVRHPREIDNDRITANILTQSQGHRRCHIIIGLRFDDLAKRHELAILVRYFQADIRLTGDHLDNTHAHHGQRPRQILREVDDLTHFDARRRIELEARNDRTRQYRLHFHVDVEVF